MILKQLKMMVIFIVVAVGVEFGQSIGECVTGILRAANWVKITEKVHECFTKFCAHRAIQYEVDGVIH